MEDSFPGEECGVGGQHMKAPGWPVVRLWICSPVPDWPWTRAQSMAWGSGCPALHDSVPSDHSVYRSSESISHSPAQGAVSCSIQLCQNPVVMLQKEGPPSRGRGGALVSQRWAMSHARKARLLTRGFIGKGAPRWKPGGLLYHLATKPHVSR